jgi:hypothetical protein
VSEWGLYSNMSGFRVCNPACSLVYAFTNLASGCDGRVSRRGGSCTADLCTWCPQQAAFQLGGQLLSASPPSFLTLTNHACICFFCDCFYVSCTAAAGGVRHKSTTCVATARSVSGPQTATAGCVILSVANASARLAWCPRGPSAPGPWHCPQWQFRR